MARRRSRDIDPCVIEPPKPRFQGSSLRFDPLLELSTGRESEHGHDAEPHPLFLAGQGVDDGLTLAVALAPPVAAAVAVQAGARAEHVGLKPFGLLLKRRGERVV